MRPELDCLLPHTSDRIREAVAQALDDSESIRNGFDTLSSLHTSRILQAFHRVRLDERHFHPSTGYGYGDEGREALEEVYRLVYRGEEALVRQQIVSGTHAISLCLSTFLTPGSCLVSATGSPYDTLRRVIGCTGSESGSLTGQGVRYHEAPLSPEGLVDLNRLETILKERPQVVLVQRSRGYSTAPSRDLETIRKINQEIRRLAPEAVILVDNCYGEFVEEDEPLVAGADLIAGSLIKNPGGGLAPGGGYIIGRKPLIRRIAERLYAPVIGGEIGPSLIGNRLFFQGLFLAPHFVAQALMGASFSSRLAQLLGFDAAPGFDAKRTDIIQSIRLGSAEALIRFCRGLQSASPVGAHITPEPALMPGYADPVIMAGGTFISGGSLELSADAPMRPPFEVYLQGGFFLNQIVLGVTNAFNRVMATGNNL